MLLIWIERERESVLVSVEFPILSTSRWNEDQKKETSDSDELEINWLYGKIEKNELLYIDGIMHKVSLSSRTFQNYCAARLTTFALACLQRSVHSSFFSLISSFALHLISNFEFFSFHHYRYRCQCRCCCRCHRRYHHHCVVSIVVCTVDAQQKQ